VHTPPARFLRLCGGFGEFSENVVPGGESREVGVGELRVAKVVADEGEPVAAQVRARIQHVNNTEGLDGLPPAPAVAAADPLALRLVAAHSRCPLRHEVGVEPTAAGR
jgi:hypothetical protein